MGLKNKENKVFVKFREGKFYKTADKENSEPYSDLEGIITGVYLRTDTFMDGKIKKEVEKLNVDVTSEGETYTLGLTFDSAVATKLLNFLKGADLSEPVTLNARVTKDGDKIIFVTQHGNSMKSSYTKDSKDGPKMKKLKSGKWDKEEFLEFYRNLIESYFKPALLSDVVYVPEGEPVHDEEAEKERDYSDDLPF